MPGSKDDFLTDDEVVDAFFSKVGTPIKKDIRIIPEGKLEKLVKPIYDGLKALEKAFDIMTKDHQQIVIDIANLKKIHYDG